MHHWFDDSWVWSLLAVAALVVAGLLALLIWLRLTATRRHTLSTLRNISDRFLHHIVLPDGVDGHIGIDALVLRDGRLYVLMLRDAEGAIFGAEKMDQWTAISRDQRFNFRNPLYVIHDQVLALRALAPEIEIEPRIIFTQHASFPKGRPDGVELLAEFAKTLHRSKKFKVPELGEQLSALWMKLRETAGVPEGKETLSLKA